MPDLHATSSFTVFPREGVRQAGAGDAGRFHSTTVVSGTAAGGDSGTHFKRHIQPGERELLLYRHNVAVTAREYGMPMLNDCGEVVGLIRPDPDLSLCDLNDRVGPDESTFSVAGAEARRAVAELGVEVQTADTLCPDASATVAQQAARARELEDEPRQAREAANTARRATEEARARATEDRSRGSRALGGRRRRKRSGRPRPVRARGRACVAVGDDSPGSLRRLKARMPPKVRELLRDRTGARRPAPGGRPASLRAECGRYRWVRGAGPPDHPA